MIMVGSFGGKQRTKADFAALPKRAGARYEVHTAHATGPLGLLDLPEMESE